MMTWMFMEIYKAYFDSKYDNLTEQILSNPKLRQIPKLPL